MSISAAELLASNKDIDIVSQGILHVADALDNLGAREWNLRWVGGCACIILFAIRLTFQEKGKVHWAAITHNALTAVGALMAAYLDFFASEILTGQEEPTRSCLCGGPLTSIHRITPAISMGYAVMDLLDGLKLGPEFAAHGLATFVVMAFFVESDLPQLVVPYLLMEISTVFLCLVKASFLSANAKMVMQLLFAVNFFIFRVIVSPYLYARTTTTMYTHYGDAVYQSCVNPYVFPFTAVFGIFFHSLNAFWFYKILRKFKRTFWGNDKDKSGSSNKDEKGHPVYDDDDDDDDERKPEDKENVRGHANELTYPNGQQIASVLNVKKND